MSTSPTLHYLTSCVGLRRHILSYRLHSPLLMGDPLHLMLVVHSSMLRERCLWRCRVSVSKQSLIVLVVTFYCGHFAVNNHPR